MSCHVKSLPTLLVLDLDETLIHTDVDPLERDGDFTISLEAVEHHVYCRPHLSEFLTFAFATFSDVAIWTSATEDYAREIVQQILTTEQKPLFLWSRSRCACRFDHESQVSHWIKDIRKLRRWGFSKARILFVDDDARAIERSYGNHVPVAGFLGNEDDSELQELIPFLTRLSGMKDVRGVEKRFWRQRSTIGGRPADRHRGSR